MGASCFVSHSGTYYPFHLRKKKTIKNPTKGHFLSVYNQMIPSA